MVATNFYNGSAMTAPMLNVFGNYQHIETKAINWAAGSASSQFTSGLTGFSHYLAYWHLRNLLGGTGTEVLLTVNNVTSQAYTTLNNTTIQNDTPAGGAILATIGSIGTAGHVFVQADSFDGSGNYTATISANSYGAPTRAIAGMGAVFQSAGSPLTEIAFAVRTGSMIGSIWLYGLRADQPT